MNATTVEAGRQPAQEGVATKAKAGGAILEGIGGIAVIALAIVGLVGVLSLEMAAIATIVLGAAVLVEGGSFAASHREMWSTKWGYFARAAEWSQGLSAEFLGAVAGIVLGILALLGSSPVTLLSVAAIVYGGTFAFSGMGGSGVGNRAAIGLAGLVLGILAVCGLASLPLVLVALICLGAATLFTGAATSATVAAERLT